MIPNFSAEVREYALLVAGEFKEIRSLPNRPPHIPHKNVEWYPVVREHGDPLIGLDGDNYVIRMPAPPAPRRMIEKWIVMDRLTDEQLNLALSLMTVRQQEKWRMPGYPAVYADDPELLALIAAIGADPEVVLA